MTITLPTEKSPPTLTAATAKILLYGPPGIGKTTTSVSLHPRTLLLEVEPGAGGVEAYKLPIRSWEEFRQTGAALAQEAQKPAEERRYDTVVVDTTDELFRYCQEYVTKLHNIKHPSDLDYGKGWTLLSDEFRLRVGKLAGLGLGVIFISHAKTEEVKQRVGSITKTVPTLTGQAGKFLTGFVDYILFADYDAEGQRVLRTQPTENYDAKQRLPLPDPIPLDGAALAAAFEGK